MLVDRATGAVLTALTTAEADDTKIYQTHPQWTASGTHVVFRSVRPVPGRPGPALRRPRAHRRDRPAHRRPWRERPPDSLAVARRSNKLYHLRNEEGRTHLIELDLDPLLSDRDIRRGQARPYERVVAVLPPDYRGEGGLTLDAGEKVAYLGVNLQDPPPREPGKPLPQVPGGDPRRRPGDRCLHQGRRHAVPRRARAGEPVGARRDPLLQRDRRDAPQRMWVVKADGSGNRPLFEEGPKDLVTHEVFVDRDHVMFNLMGRWPAQRTRPTGIMVVGLRDGFVEPVGQVAGPRLLA